MHTSVDRPRRPVAREEGSLKRVSGATHDNSSFYTAQFKYIPQYQTDGRRPSRAESPAPHQITKIQHTNTLDKEICSCSCCCCCCSRLLLFDRSHLIPIGYRPDPAQKKTKAATWLCCAVPPTLRTPLHLRRRLQRLRRRRWLRRWLLLAATALRAAGKRGHDVPGVDLLQIDPDVEVIHLFIFGVVGGLGWMDGS